MTTFQEARAFLLKHRTDYDAAVKLTETHPHLAYGGSIELRKVY